MRCDDCRGEITGDQLCFISSEGYVMARDITAVEEVEELIMCVDCQEYIDDREE